MSFYAIIDHFMNICLMQGACLIMVLHKTGLTVVLEL